MCPLGGGVCAEENPHGQTGEPVEQCWENAHKLPGREQPLSPASSWYQCCEPSHRGKNIELLDIVSSPLPLNHHGREWEDSEITTMPAEVGGVVPQVWGHMYSRTLAKQSLVGWRCLCSSCQVIHGEGFKPEVANKPGAAAMWWQLHQAKGHQMVWWGNRHYGHKAAHVADGLDHPVTSIAGYHWYCPPMR